MKILLIDADSVIPNLALMKLSSYHKSLGHTTTLLKLNLPYYPNRKKIIQDVGTSSYDKAYCSVVFSGNLPYIKGNNIEFGGTGYSLKKDLPQHIEDMSPDYTIYPDNDTSYGFITRGCIRNCYFCVVPQKEGHIRQVNIISNIVKHKKVKFMDNNILALPNHKDILHELVDRKIKYQFNQGLDIRLIDKDNSYLLSKSNYLNEYIFAFDDWKYKKIIDKALILLSWRKDWQFKFFVYCEKSIELSSIIDRVNYLKENKCLPYIMRDINCWEGEYKDFYVDIASWCNQPGLFKNMTFDEFLDKRHTKTDRIKESSYLYSQYS